jgi:hypothetical protein
MQRGLCQQVTTVYTSIVSVLEGGPWIPFSQHHGILERLTQSIEACTEERMDE